MRAHPVTVDVAPETISIASGASNVGFVLISTSRDIGIQASGAVKATASGFIFLGSPGDVQVDQIKAGTAGNNPTGADVRLKAQGQITDAASILAAQNVTLADATVTFANVANSGTITRVDGGTWAGYTVGQGIVIAGTKLVTVAAGDNVLIAQGYDSTKGTAGHYYQYTGGTASLDLANTNYKTGPWVDLGTLKFTSQGSGGVTNSQSVHLGDVVQVSQGYDSTKGVAGNLYAYKGTTATLDLASANYTDTSKWTNLGAPKFDTQPTGGGYYTIVAIDATQKVITLKGGQLLTPETGVAVKVAAFAPVVNIEGASLVLEAGQAQIGTAAAPINVEILGTGTFTARALNDIFINAIGNIPVDGIYSASAGVHLAATGSIYDAIASLFAKIQGTSIELQVFGANSTIGQDLLHPLHIDIVSQGTLQAIAAGDIAIDQSQGDLYVLDVLSKSGDVALGAQGFLFNGGNLVDPTKLDSGLAVGNAGANVRGNTILLNPDATSPSTLWTQTVGGIGSGATSFNIISAYSGAGTLSAIAGNQDIDIVQTIGDVSLMSISSGSAQVAFITALAGSILNGRPDENAIVKAGKADLIASGSVGSGNLRNGGLSGRIVSTVGNVEAIATTGSIWLWNKGALTVGGVVPVATSPYAMYAPNGSVNIQTSSPVTVILDNFSSGDILYQAGTAGASDDNLTVNSGVTLHSTGGSVELDAGNNVTVQAGAVIQAATGITIRGAYLQPTATFLNPYLASAPVAAQVSFGNVGNSGTITLTSGTWAALGYVVGGGIYVQSASDPNGNGATFNAGSYYTIAAISGATLTLKSGQVLTDESNVTLGLAPVIAGSTVDLAGSFTAPTLTVLTGGGSDDIELHPAVLAANTFVSTGAGNDLIHLYDMPTITAANSGVVDTVHLDGQDGADTYVVDTTGDTNYIVSVHDTGALDSGTNALIINGTSGADTFLVRPYLVAALEANGSGGYKQSYERINYDETVTDRLTINGGDGDDSFFLDGNSAVMTLDGGAGKDSFQVGQMYATSAIGNVAGDPGALVGDEFTATLTTLGYLSEGIDKATVIYGGDGNDEFQVYSNKADLSLFGEAGDDTFIVRAFLVADGTHIKVDGGVGDDTIRYNIDAPVQVDGGTGFNTLVLLGTEADDTFVITKDGIFGGGLNVAYTNIQAVTVDALEGNDKFYVLSTLAGVSTTLIGGVGGDTFVIGGDVQGTVVSANTKGASGVVDHTVTSADGSYNGIFVDGIGLTVGGSGGALIQQGPQTVVHANDPTSIASFVVTMPTQPSGSSVAYVDVSPAAVSGGAAGCRRQGPGGLDRRRALVRHRHARVQFDQLDRRPDRVPARGCRQQQPDPGDHLDRELGHQRHRSGARQAHHAGRQGLHREHRVGPDHRSGHRFDHDRGRGRRLDLFVQPFAQQAAGRQRNRHRRSDRAERRDLEGLERQPDHVGVLQLEQLQHAADDRGLGAGRARPGKRPCGRYPAFDLDHRGGVLEYRRCRPREGHGGGHRHARGADSAAAGRGQRLDRRTDLFVSDAADQGPDRPGVRAYPQRRADVRHHHRPALARQSGPVRRAEPDRGVRCIELERAGHRHPECQSEFRAADRSVAGQHDGHDLPEPAAHSVANPGAAVHRRRRRHGRSHARRRGGVALRDQQPAGSGADQFGAVQRHRHHEGL